MSDTAPQPDPPPQDGPSQDRRGFFSQAAREAMGPLASLLEKRITPILQAMEQFPDDVTGTLDELARLPEPPPARVPLDQLAVTPLEDDKHSKISGRNVEPERFLRPPGAVADFATVCSRCRACVRACPADAIQIGTVAGGLPYIVATEMPCVVCESLACMNQCPSGTLKLTDKFDIDMGTAKVNHATCLRTHGEACQICVEACPIGESALVISQATGRVHVKINGCVGCGVCEQRCPTAPASILVIPRALRPDPIIA